jgi:hypothetical protein
MVGKTWPGDSTLGLPCERYVRVTVKVRVRVRVRVKVRVRVRVRTSV